MSVRRRTPARGAFRSARPGTDWARLVQAVPISIAGASQKVLLASVALSNQGIAETVRRLILDYLVQSDQVATTELQSGALGFIVINDLAVAAGAASIPGPITDANDDGWFLWQSYQQIGRVGTGSAGGNFTSFQRHAESKAMRRVEEGFSIAFMLESGPSTDPSLISFGFSLLSSRTSG